MHWPRPCYARELVLPVSLCASALAAALILAIALGIRGTAIVGEYYAISLVRMPVALYVWFLIGARKAEFRAAPHRALAEMLRERWLLLVVPALVVPAFMTAFTTLKCAFPLLTGYHWDARLARIDVALFGQDPWRITHAWIGSRGTLILAYLYTAVWGLVVAFGPPLYALYGNPTKVARAYSALFLSWLVVGVGFAALLSSAGPVFAGAVDPSLASHFAPLQAVLHQPSAMHNPIGLSQDYLAHDLLKPITVKGGGVSAMPSMHIGVCTFFVLLAGRTRWRWAAIALTASIWVGSIHFGYHYATDGPVAALLALLCWRLAHAERWLPARAPARQPVLAAA